jgi:HD superfamily phosphohydrolase
MTNEAERFQPVTVIRDQLYDRIPMSGPELELISTPAFQRLERIQQLGFASRIWPGARHTRFEHSLGVMHLGRQAIEHLRGRAGFSEADRAFLAAALLHDVGHYPFSHAIEELGAPIRPHEVVGRQLITRGEIASILTTRWEVDPAAVAAYIDPSEAEATGPDPVLAALLSGPLDIDKLDYLPRDARACGVPYGGVDTERLIASLVVRQVSGADRLLIGEKGISPTHSLINARQEMFDNVYWHHTNRACMVMLLRAVQEALLAGRIDPDELSRVDDFSMLRLLNRDDMPAITRTLCEGLKTRHIHKRAIEISSRAGDLYANVSGLFHDAGLRRNVERTLSGSVTGNPDDGAILIDIPKPEKWRTDVMVWFHRPPIGFDNLMTWQEVAGMTDDDLKRYESHRRLVRIVVRADLAAITQATWRNELERALADPVR